MVPLLCIIGDYSEYNYELLAAESSFQTSEDAKEKSFGPCSYIKYLLFEFLSFFGCTPNWEDMKAVDETKEVIGEELDIKVCLKRLNYLENCMRCILTE